MYSSGTTALATSGAAAVTPSGFPGSSYNVLTIINEGTAPGFFSVDGGNNWGRIPAGNANGPGTAIWRGRSNKAPQIKRDGSSDMSGVYLWTDWLDNGK